MLLFFVLAVGTIASAVTVSPPLGKYAVASSIMELTDCSRQDPFAPGHQSRRLMLSAFYPAGLKEDCQPYSTWYMPPTTAALYDAMYASLGIMNGTFESIKLSLCDPHASRHEGHLSHPIVLFSPGLGNSRLVYSAMATSLSSQGFAVITIDHPYDASIVEYPDGSFLLAANITTDDQIEFGLTVRQKDVSFVINQLRRSSIRQHLFQGVARVQELDHTLIYGHSLGGATAAAVMLEDRRVVGGINLDGTMFGSVIERGLNCPLMLFSHEGKNLSTDSSWASIWPHLRSTKVEVSLLGSQHGTFTDFPFLVQALGFPRTHALTSLLGDIKGDRVLDILRVYISNFLEFAIGDYKAPVKKNAGKAFLEIEMLNMTEQGRCR